MCLRALLSHRGKKSGLLLGRGFQEGGGLKQHLRTRVVGTDYRKVRGRTDDAGAS